MIQLIEAYPWAFFGLLFVAAMGLAEWLKYMEGK